MNKQGSPASDLEGLLAGRRVVVTGAAQGIGEAVSRACEQAGAIVRRLDVKPGEGIIACDVTDEIAIASAFDRISSEGQIDDIVHAAGIVAIGSVAETSVAEFKKVIDVNLIGTFIVAREAGRHLLQGGNLILLASQAGLKGGALWSAYSASKGGVLRLADCLVEELAENGVRVNSISPGNVDSSMTDSAIDELSRRSGETSQKFRAKSVRGIPLGRFAEADEIGRAVVAVCSGLLSYVNGANLVIDGGELSR